MLSIDTVISVAKISEYLAASDIASAPIFGGRLDTELARKIYIERISLEYIYTLSPASIGIRGAANYLYALCGKYAVRAVQILGAGSQLASGTVGYQLPQSQALSLPDQEVIVGVDDGAPLDGASSWDLSILGIDSTGFFVRLTINKIPQTQKVWDGVRYSKLPSTNTLQLYGTVFSANDLVQLQFHH